MQPPLLDRDGKTVCHGLDDLEGTLAQIADDAPIILFAHEPDIFAEVPDRVSLTLCGHTHGGQPRIFGYSPFTPSRFGNRYAYGHVVEDGRHPIVSGGFGVSVVPVRIGTPREIVVVARMMKGRCGDVVALAAQGPDPPLRLVGC